MNLFGPPAARHLADLLDLIDVDELRAVADGVPLRGDDAVWMHGIADAVAAVRGTDPTGGQNDE